MSHRLKLERMLLSFDSGKLIKTREIMAVTIGYMFGQAALEEVPRKGTRSPSKQQNPRQHGGGRLNIMGLRPSSAQPFFFDWIAVADLS